MGRRDINFHGLNGKRSATASTANAATNANRVSSVEASTIASTARALASAPSDQREAADRAAARSYCEPAPHRTRFPEQNRRISDERTRLPNPFAPRPVDFEPDRIRLTHLEVAVASLQIRLQQLRATDSTISRQIGTVDLLSSHLLVLAGSSAIMPEELRTYRTTGDQIAANCREAIRDPRSAEFHGKIIEDHIDLLRALIGTVRRRMQASVSSNRGGTL